MVIVSVLLVTVLGLEGWRILGDVPDNLQAEVQWLQSLEPLQ